MCAQTCGHMCGHMCVRVRARACGGGGGGSVVWLRSVGRGIAELGHIARGELDRHGSADIMAVDSVETVVAPG